MKRKYGFVFGMLFGILAASVILTTLYVEQTKEHVKEDEINIVTSFYPMYIATLNIVGDIPGVNLQSLSEPQTGCLHDFQLTPEDMKLLSEADIFIINGGGMESFMEEIAHEYPNLVIVDASKDVALIEDEHEHVNAHTHSHSQNGHAWLSIKNYRKQVATIADELSKAEPNYAQDFRRNADDYDGQLAELQKEQDIIVEKVKGTNVIIFHEAFAYVAKDYGFVVSYEVNLDEERQVSAGEVAKVVSAIEEEQVQYLLVEERYGKELAKTIEKETGVTVIYLDTLNHGAYDSDSYIEGMHENIELLEGVQ